MLRRPVVILAAAAVTATLAAGALGRPAATPKLQGTVGPGFTISLKRRGVKVKTLKPGKYTFVVSDKAHTTNQDARLVIAPDGTLYMTFLGGPNEKSLKDNFVAVAKSTNGRTWSATHEVAPIVVPTPGLLPNSNYRTPRTCAPRRSPNPDSVL